MRCPLCGGEFTESAGKSSCQGCPLGGSCHMVRCPNCGYDIPAEPRILKALKKLGKKK